MPLLKFRRLLYLNLLAGILSAGSDGLGLAHAKAPASTLERIRQTGVLRIGAMGKTLPFSYLDAGGNFIGYSIERTRRTMEKPL